MPDRLIDLRSDTLTRPTAAMRQAMADAQVGDDQYGEDVSVNALEARIAELLGKQAAVFVPSGTMANQIAVKVLTRPGEEVITGGEAHLLWHEAGGASANAGVQIIALGLSGIFTAAELRAAYKPRGHMVYPPTTLVVIENTHNRGGGVIFPQPLVEEVCEAADALGMTTYLDGARLFNAAVATGTSPRDLAAPFRMAGIALSKGLGCPVGSVIAGSAEDMVAARRQRRLFGGAMRQAGILAAAGLHALDHHMDRLAEDHANARLIGEHIAEARNAELDLATVQSNIVVFRTRPEAPPDAEVIARAREHGVLLLAFGPRMLRMVTHLDVSRADCDKAGTVVAGILDGRS
ncbi:MAG: threonine aldolase [Xanthobacteraceae bacterium]|nr:threonine aldolase [Xanthobacteraceae bacterium]